MSPTFLKEKGYSFKIYSNEEERMHIHVIKDDKEAKFWLEPKVETAYKGDFSQSEINKIQTIVELFMQSTLRSNTNSTSADVLMINDRGIMLSVQGQDYFLSYNRVPWMKDATINDVLNVRMSGQNAIEWPKLDVDLEIDSLKYPERYPLLIKRNELDYVS